MEYRLYRSSRKTVALQVTRDGEVVVRAPLWMPKRDIERFVTKHTDWIQKRLIAQQEYRESHPEPTPEEILLLKEKAATILPSRVAFFAAKMGVSPTGIKITGAKTRFGSCSGKNSLCFSYRLMNYPETAIDYVVVHELAHIRQHNHSADFYRLVESVLPDYKERAALLRK